MMDLMGFEPVLGSSLLLWRTCGFGSKKKKNGSGFLGNSSLKPAVNSQLIPGSKLLFPKKSYFQKFWFQFQN